MAKRKLLLMIDQDVCGFITFDDSFPKNATMADDLTNNPTVIKIAAEDDVPLRKWKYDGESFYDPNK